MMGLPERPQFYCLIAVNIDLSIIGHNDMTFFRSQETEWDTAMSAAVLPCKC